MINNIDDFKKELLSSGIAEGEYQLVGCCAQELDELEAVYGSLPTVYKQIMQTIGRRAGKLVWRGEYDFYIDQISELNEVYQEIIQESWEEEGYSGNVFLICDRYGSDYEFVLTNNGSDSPVFISHENSAIKQNFSSVWEWIESFIEDAKAIMKLPKDCKSQWYW
jgi:hypothetical protein